MKVRICGTESFPLHHSQQEVETAEQYSVFTLRVVPTFDLLQEILAKGNTVEVLSPEPLRNWVAEKAGKTTVEVKLVDETIWLTQTQIAAIYGVDRTVIGRHINKIYKDLELMPEATCAKYAQVQTEGDRQVHRTVNLYNLDVVISVGYRVNSRNATTFRIWANSVLKEYLVKGYAVRNNILQERYNELRTLVDTMGRTMKYLDASPAEQIKSIFDVVRDYSYAFVTEQYE